MKSIEEVKDNLRDIKEFVRECLVDGVDYGIIPRTTKPSLFKSGAEKFCLWLGVVPTYTVETSYQNWTDVIQWKNQELSGFASYTVNCVLRNEKGEIVGTGYGSCNTGESRYIKLPAAASDNTCLKMAQKRSLVAAVISTAMISEMFTQDTEDIDSTLLSDNQSPPKKTFSKSTTKSPANVIKSDPEDPVIAFGSSKGKKVSEVDEESLQWYLNVAKKNVEEGKFVDKNQKMIDIISKRLKG